MAGKIKSLSRSDGVTTDAPTSLAYSGNLDAATVGGADNDGTDGYLLLKDQSSDPSAPTGDDIKFYAKDGEIKKIDSTSNYIIPTKDYVDAAAGGGIFSAKSADYVITDADNVRTVGMTTAATDRTVTLPTAADNTHRIITVKKVDSGAGKVTVLGEAAGETIDGVAGDTGIDLTAQYAELTVQCDGSIWHILTGAEATADRPGLVPSYQYEELDISSSGDFSAAQPVLRIAKVGSVVTLTWADLTNTADTAPTSAAGFIPSVYRPTANVRNCIVAGSSAIVYMTINTGGSLSYIARNYSGTAISASGLNGGSISWVVDE